MSRLIDALKARFRTPEEALKALGLDVALLRSAVVGDALPRRLSRKRKLARDAEPNKQFEREQLAGEDDEENFPEGIPRRRPGSSVDSK